MQMQLFGSSILPFTTSKQTIVTNGIARFLGTGVTGSQISLSVDNTIAGVSSHIMLLHHALCDVVQAHLKVWPMGLLSVLRQICLNLNLQLQRCPAAHQHLSWQFEWHTFLSSVTLTTPLHPTLVPFGLADLHSRTAQTVGSRQWGAWGAAHPGHSHHSCSILQCHQCYSERHQHWQPVHTMGPAW